jgi:protein SSD1
LHDCVATDMESGLRDMAKLASSLRQRRLGLNPSAIGQKTKLTFELNDHGFPEAISSQSHCEAQDAYQELCIMANLSVAQKNTKHFPDHALLRRQDPIIDTLLRSFAPNDSDIDMNSLSKDAFEAALLGLTKTEEQTLLRFLAAKSARPGLYFSAGTTDINKYFHHGHGISLYTHFTSPVCRYAAIIVHRQLEAALKQGMFFDVYMCYRSKIVMIVISNAVNILDKDIHGDKEYIEKLIMHCNVRENACRNASEQSSRLYLCSYLNRQTLTASNCVESACVFSVQNDSIDIYIPAYDMRQRIYLDDITPNHTYDAESNSITLSWQVEEAGYGAGDDELLLEDVEADLPSDQSTAWSSAVEQPLHLDKVPISSNDITINNDIGPNGTPFVVQNIRRMSNIDVSISVDMHVSPPVIIVDVINPTTK